MLSGQNCSSKTFASFCIQKPSKQKTVRFNRCLHSVATAPGPRASRPRATARVGPSAQVAQHWDLSHAVLGKGPFCWSTWRKVGMFFVTVVFFWIKILYIFSLNLFVKKKHNGSLYHATQVSSIQTQCGGDHCGREEPRLLCSTVKKTSPKRNCF